MEKPNNLNLQGSKPASEMSSETRARIDEMVEKLKGKELFPERTAQVKELFSKVKSLPI